MNRLNSLAQTDNSPSFVDLDSTVPSALHVHDTSPHWFAAALDSPRDAAWSTDASGCHALFAPIHYEPGYAYPLLVWLHAAGGSERELRQVMPRVSLRNYVGAAPRGIADLSADDDFSQDDGAVVDDNVRPGYTWRQTAPHILLAEQRLFSCIAHAQRKFHVAGQRIFLAGHGAGGTMALRLALTHPERFSGAITIAGPLPRGAAPLARVRAARRLPILIAAGQNGVAYAQSAIADDLRLLHAAGMSVSVRLYPGGDELSDLHLADLDRWMMEQICPGSSTPSMQECDLS